MGAGQKLYNEIKAYGHARGQHHVKHDNKHLRHSVVAASIKLFENCIGKLRLVTVKELAVVLKTSEKTIRDWVLKKKIPLVRLGGMVRFHPLEIANWLAERSEYS